MPDGLPLLCACLQVSIRFPSVYGWEPKGATPEGFVVVQAACVRRFLHTPKALALSARHAYGTTCAHPVPRLNQA